MYFTLVLQKNKKLLPWIGEKNKKLYAENRKKLKKLLGSKSDFLKKPEPNEGKKVSYKK